MAYRSGQVVQRLQHSGLIEIVPGEARRPVSYRLTPKGRFAAAIFNRVQPMPSAAGLWAEMERHRERMRARKGFGPTGAWSPTQDAALRALREFGPLTRRQLDAAMDIKFKSGRSLNLALSQMAKRGLVRRARDAGGNLRTGSYVAPLWECAGNSEDSRESPTRVEDRQAQ